MEFKIQCAGYEIAADWLDGDNSRILIILPGYTSSKARQRTHAEAMVEKTGASALVVDFSGHGNSPFNIDDTRPAQHFLELIYVFDWVKSKYPQAKISVSGSSYGGFLAVQLTKYRKFDNLILRAPAIYRPSAFYDLWSKRTANPSAYEAKIREYRHDTEALAKHPLLARASAFEGNTLVVVHGNDEIVPRETTDAYIQAFHAESFVVEGLGHSLYRDDDEARFNTYQDKIASWLNKS